MDTLELPAGTFVHAYRNLVRARAGGPPVFSVRHRARVVAHVTGLVLADAVFRVQPAGRARARASGQRNVHAYVAGTLATQAPPSGGLPVHYRVFGPDGFRTDDGELVITARWVVLGAHGCRVWV